MPVYQGANSCYAMNEQVYVRRIRRKGIDTLREAAAILYLILKDYKRGWTYEQGSCRKIRMTKDLFEKRVRFVAFLAKQHGAEGEVLRAIRRLVRYVLRKKRLPRRIRVGRRNVNLQRLVDEALARKR